MRKLNPIPYFLHSERSPLVDQLIDLLRERDGYIQDLEEELQRLKKLPKKPEINKESARKDKKKKDAGKRPGSAKAQKTKGLPIHKEKVLSVKNKPADARFKGYRKFVVQEISIQLANLVFKCERWQCADGSYIQAELPKEYKNQHFGPYLRTYILHQVYHQGVTRNLLLGQLREWGIQISEGQLNNILIKEKDTYHAEKRNIFEAGCRYSSYLQADDTGARHRGMNGFCTYIGNEDFAFYESSFSKSRINFLKCLTQALPEAIGFCLDESALSYVKQIPQISLRITDILGHVISAPEFFYTEIELHAYLEKYGITSSYDIRACTEAALFSPLKRFLFQKDTFLLTDEAGQFRLPYLKHALCWLHIERKFKQLVPFTNEQGELIKQKQDELWKLYEDLKHYRFNPLEAQKSLLRQQFYALCAPIENEVALNEILNRIKRWEEKLLLVLDYPFLPLHNNTSESDIREVVRRRKVSGGTRHD